MADKKKFKKTTTKRHLARTQREARQTRLIIIITAIVGVLILGLVIYGTIEHFVLRPSRPVAQVGNTIISVRDFESYVQYTRVQMLNQIFQYYSFHQQFGEFGGGFLETAQSMASQLAQPVDLGRQVLDEMIDNHLIRQEAAQMGISASEEEINEAVQAAFGFFPEGTPTPTITITLQATPTLSETQLALVTLTSTPAPTDLEGESPPEFPEEDMNEDGEDIEEFTPDLNTEDDQIDEDLEEISDDTEEIPAVAEPTPTITLTPTATLTPTPYTTQMFAEDIQEFNQNFSMYNFDINDLREIFEIQILRQKLTEEITKDLELFKNEVWARHILVESQEAAFEVLALLNEGEEFHQLAETYSLDESNRDKGGDLGWFDENTMVPAFSETAFSLEIGEISDPVETNFGYHIIQVLGLRENQVSPEQLAQTKRMEFNAWLTELRNQRDDIVIFDNWANFVPTSPEIPQQFLMELFQQQPAQDMFPPITP